MNKTILFDFRVYKENNKINVERSFDVFNEKFPEGGLRRFGDVAMPDGAPPIYFASLKDKYGINWMINYQNE